ncbi:MAG TPA: hypothetical protein VJU52_05260 [Flavobacterium sp.]|nr:hypothetical protein [Flavobacterium sp.]
MNEDVKIISKHNLDCSSLENLASDIAIRLGCNIEYGQYQNENNSHNFNVLGTVTINDSNIVTTLYDLRNDEDSTYDFVLELGEDAKVIYKDFIDFMPPWEEQFDRLASEFKKNGLANDSLYSGVFNELHKLGADTVYFIKDTFVPELAIPENIIMDTYLKKVEKETILFEVPLML